MNKHYKGTITVQNTKQFSDEQVKARQVATAVPVFPDARRASVPVAVKRKSDSNFVVLEGFGPRKTCLFL